MRLLESPNTPMGETPKKTVMSVAEAAICAGATYVWQTQYDAGAAKGWAEGWATGWAAARDNKYLNPKSITKPATCVTSGPRPKNSFEETRSGLSAGKIQQSATGNDGNREGLDHGERGMKNEDDDFSEESNVENYGVYQHANNANDFSNDINPDVTDAEDDVVELEMNPEWAQLFIRGEQRRKRQRLHASQDENDFVEHKCIESADRKKETFNLISKNPIDFGGIRDAERHIRAQRWYGDCMDEVLELEAEMDSNFQQVVSETNAQFWPVV